MKQLRLLVTDICNRSCEGCCNKQWDLKALPIYDFKEKFDIVCLTGGEPLLYPSKCLTSTKTIKTLDKDTSVFIYSAMIKNPEVHLSLLNYIDGLTLTLHEPEDVTDFIILNNSFKNLKNKSLRLNVFKGINLDGIDLSLWKVKDNIEWIKDCPLPNEEVFKRI